MQQLILFVSPKDACRGAHTAGPQWPLLRDALYCLVSCSPGGYAGWAIGIVLAWQAPAVVALALTTATASCMFLLECPMARRGVRYWKQFG